MNRLVYKKVRSEAALDAVQTEEQEESWKVNINKKPIKHKKSLC